MRSEHLPLNVVSLHPRLKMTLLSRTTSGREQLLEENIDAVRLELREVAEQLRRATRKLAAIEASADIDATAIRVATTHVTLVCRPSGYALAEADEPPPAAGESVEITGERFVVDRLTVSPLPGDCRRCAILVFAGPSVSA